MKEIKITLSTGEILVFSWKSNGKAVQKFIRGPYKLGPGRSINHEIDRFVIDKNKVSWDVRTPSGKIETHEAEGTIVNIS